MTLVRLLAQIGYLKENYLRFVQHFFCDCYIFPLVLKTTKVVPVFKKDSKLDYNNSSNLSVTEYCGNT